MKYKNIVIAIGFLLAFSIKQDLKGQSHLSINSASTMAFSKAGKAPDSENPQLTLLKGGGIFQSLNTSMVGGSIGLERTNALSGVNGVSLWT